MSYSFDIKFKVVKIYLEESIGSITIEKEVNLKFNKIVLFILLIFLSWKVVNSINTKLDKNN